MKNPYKKLEKQLGYSFRKKKRLRNALTHRSYRFERQAEDADNQRLEYLGDAALGFVTAAYLFKKYPALREGDLTKLRSRITSGKPLADIAQRCDLGEYLLLGRGEAQSGGHARPSNLTDAMEAVIGAAYVDGNTKAVERIFKKLIVPYMEEVDLIEDADNPKGQLQELAQGRWKTTPRYRVISEEGPSHKREYTVDVRLQDYIVGTGAGPNKREAQMAAAKAALEIVEAMTELPEEEE